MALSDQEVKDLEALPGILRPLLPIIGLSNPAIAAVTFAYGMLFRILKLGDQIRKELDEAGEALDKSVKARGLFRVPIEVDTPISDIQSFLTQAKFRYPKAFAQLERDRVVVDIPGHAQRHSALARLSLARQVVPRVYDLYETEGRLSVEDDPLLDDVFLQLLNPVEPNIYWSLVENLRQEKATLLFSEEVSLSALEDRMPTYLRMKLELEQAALDASVQKKLEDVNQTIRQLSIKAIIGGGAVKEISDFIVDQTLDSVEKELGGLKEEEEQINAQSPAERDKERLKQIKKRRKDLEQLKERVHEAKK